MKRFLSLALTIIMIFSLASCSDDGAGGSIHYALDSSPSTLDPQYTGETSSQIVINNVFEGLVRISENGEVQILQIDENHQRFVTHKVDWNVKMVRLTPLETHGCKDFRIFSFEIS